MARYCQNCNNELPGRAKFCRMCGTPTAYVPMARPQSSPPAPDRRAERPLEQIAPGAERLTGPVPATERIDKPTKLDKPARIDKSAGLDNTEQHNGQAGGQGLLRREMLGQEIVAISPADVPEANMARRGTAQTEPALLERLAERNGEELPIAPATHAMIGLFEQAGFALRIGAFMFDLLLLMFVLLASALIANILPEYGMAIQTGGFFIALACWVVNSILFAGRTGQTIGKRLVGIRIISVDQRRAGIKQILLRHLIGYPLSLFGVALGFGWILWDRQQQGWHDKLAGTLVVRKRLNW